jgi:hypothetical protein
MAKSPIINDSSALVIAIIEWETHPYEGHWGITYFREFLKISIQKIPNGYS